MNRNSTAIIYGVMGSCSFTNLSGLQSYSSFVSFRSGTLSGLHFTDHIRLINVSTVIPQGLLYTTTSLTSIGFPRTLYYQAPCCQCSIVPVSCKQIFFYILNVLCEEINVIKKTRNRFNLYQWISGLNISKEEAFK